MSTTPLTLSQIDAIEALAAKATPGPWMPVRSATCGHLRAAHNYQDDARKEWTDADLSLVAELRNSLPSLLAAARRGIAAEAVVERVVEAAKVVTEQPWISSNADKLNYYGRVSVVGTDWKALQDALASMEART